MIERLQNIGPKSSAWLRRLHITTLRELRRRGATRVYRDLLKIGHPRNKNMWYALRGAELGLPWQHIARQEKRRPTLPESEESPARSKRIDGVKIKYWEFHSHQPQILFFWHGFRGSHRGLRRVAENLTEYRVIVPDLPGWGESDALPVEHTLENTIRYLNHFITSFNRTEYLLAGHSFGATLAIMYAARYPKYLKKLILVQPVVNASSFTSRLGEVYYETVAKLPPTIRRQIITSPLLNRGKSELLSVETNLRRRRTLMANEQKNLSHVRDWVEIEMYRSLAKADFFAAIKNIRTPVTLIAGTRDRMTSGAVTKKIAAALPGHQVETIPKAGHFVPMEKPDLLAAMMNRVLGGSTRKE